MTGCDAKSGYWLCTLDSGHDGDHVAQGGGEKVWHTWPQTPAASRSGATPQDETNRERTLRLHLASLPANLAEVARGLEAGLFGPPADGGQKWANAAGALTTIRHAIVAAEELKAMRAASSSGATAEANAVLEAIAQVVNGESVSDFMLSFPLVRQIDDLVRSRASSGALVAQWRQLADERPQGLQADLIRSFADELEAALRASSGASAQQG